MKFSASIEYAIHALVYLAGVAPGQVALAGEVAGSIGVPEGYLRKVFQQLTRGGLLTSRRGVRGGFHLARDPGRITLKDVVEAIDGSLPLYSCLKVQRGCRLIAPCPVQDAFERARRQMGSVLEATSIADLRADISRRQPGADWLLVPC